MNKILLPLILLIAYVSVSNLTAQEYERVHPTYNSGQIDFLHISPSGKSFAMTSCGLFLKGNDSGKTWTEHEIPLGFRNGFNHLFYLDNNEQEILLESQYDVLYSTDGGDTWENRRPEGPSGFARDMLLMDNGDWLLGGFSENVIAISTDKGLSWQIDTLEFYMNQLSEVGNGILFGGNRDGMVFKSNDYGRNWIIVKDEEPSGFYASTHFTDEQTGFRMVSSIMEGSTDGGITWAPLHGAPIAFSVTYIDDQTFFSQSTQLYYVTTDAGKNWSLQRYGNDRPVIYTGLHANDANNVWAYGLNKSILSSNNLEDSESWQILDEDIFIYHIFSIDFYDENNGAACDDSGNLFITDDGGNNWTPYKTIGDRPSSIIYDSQGDIIISTSSKGLIKTSDFQNYDSLGLKDNDFNGMERIGSTIYGRDSRSIFKSVDDGENWEEIYSGDNNIFDLSLVDESKIFITIQDSLVKSLDGGENWESFYIPSAFSLAAADEDLIYFHCSDSIRVTKDGGETFEATARKPQSAQRIRLGRDGELFVYGHSGTATNQGRINRSTDGGITWPSTEGDDGCMGVYGMNFNKATQQMWFVGAGGNIMRYQRSTSLDNETIETGELKVFPNPNYGEFSIEIPNQIKKGQLSIYNQMGQLVLNQNIQTEQGLQNISIVNAGFYIITLEEDGYRFVNKIIVNK